MSASASAPLSTRELVALRLSAPPQRALFFGLVQRFGGLRGLLNASFSALNAMPRVGQERARAMASAMENAELDREVAALQHHGVRLITIEDDAYPRNLRSMPAPPPILSYIGEMLPIDDAAVAVVGSRQASPYGMQQARKHGVGLAGAGVTVVSGLAQGVDTEAMLAAARGGGRIIGVWAGGLATLLPAIHRAVGEFLPQQGAIVSEYSVRQPPQRGQFPERNAIIAGLTLGTLVVEARLGSGSLLTADLALDMGRALFAVPGDVTRESSMGVNRLIQSGAKLVIATGDILNDLQPLLYPVAEAAVAPKAQRPARPIIADSMPPAQSYTQATPPKPPPPAAPPIRNVAPSPKKVPIPARPMGDSSTAPPPVPEPVQPPQLAPRQVLVFARLEATPRHRDDLLAAVAAENMNDTELADVLLDLELDGLIRRLPGNMIRRA